MSALLSNDKVILRALEPEDLEFLYTCENDESVWHVSNTITPYSKYLLKQYIENSGSDIYTNKQLRLIIAKPSEREKAIGAIDLFDFDPYHMRAGVGILIAHSGDRRMGYASAALQLVINYCFTHLHLNQLYCNITATNTHSIRLFESVGFIRQGEKLRWLKLANGWENECFFQFLNPSQLTD